MGRTDVPALPREAAGFPEYWSYRHGGSSIFPTGQLHQVSALIIFRPFFGTGKFSTADNDVLRLHQCIVLSADQPAGTTGKALVYAICKRDLCGTAWHSHLDSGRPVLYVFSERRNACTDKGNFHGSVQSASGWLSAVPVFLGYAPLAGTAKSF